MMQVQQEGKKQESGATISDACFLRMKEFIYNACGINLTAAKKTMLEARLQKRLRKLRLQSMSQYCDYLFSQEGMEEEMVHLINEVTTNKTDFFREPSHFDYLTRYALPDLARSRRTVGIWSAGCSSGEEPYTLAMVMSEYRNIHQGINFFIVATDISTKVLEQARLAVYDEERIVPIHPELKKKYLLRSKDKTSGLYRVVPELREWVKFRHLNFMDDDFGFREPMDIIFCRNVIIYFDKATQERLLNRFCEVLSPNGYIFMGHSETLLGMDVPLSQVAPTVYRRVQ